MLLNLLPGRRALPLAAALVAAVAAGCSDPAAEYNAKVAALLKPFAGEWTVVALDRNGQKVSPGALRDITVTGDKDRFTIVEIRGAAKGGGPVTVREVHTEEYALQVDPSKPEGEINFAFASGDHTGQTRAGRYSFEGNRLTLCLGEPGGPRPATAAAGRGVTLMTLERK